MTQISNSEYIKKSEALEALGECPEIITGTDAEYAMICRWNLYRDRIQAIKGISLEDDGK